jgi:hypothetical protein
MLLSNTFPWIKLECSMEKGKENEDGWRENTLRKKPKLKVVASRTC